MGIFSTVIDFIAHIGLPWYFMSWSATHIPQTVLELIFQGRLTTFFSPSAFADVLFGNFWATFGPTVKRDGAPVIVPLIEGRIHEGRILDQPVHPPVHGVVLEVGAGSGMWVDDLARIAKSPPSSSPTPQESALRKRHPAAAAAGITKIYGVEPHPTSAKALRKVVKDAGIQDVYQVVPVGIEQVNDSSVWDGIIEPGSVDCVLTISCLCSIPEPEKNVKLLYKLLKPGGYWYVNEHVCVERGGPLLRLYQYLVNIPWRMFMGRCRLCRTTEKTLREVGPWQDIDLSQVEGEPAYHVLPHIVGTLVK